MVSLCFAPRNLHNTNAWNKPVDFCFMVCPGCSWMSHRLVWVKLQPGWLVCCWCLCWGRVSDEGFYDVRGLFPAFYRAVGGSPSHTWPRSIRAPTMPNGRGMVLWGLVILPSLVRQKRAPTRHQTKNPRLGMKSPHLRFTKDKKWWVAPKHRHPQALWSICRAIRKADAPIKRPMIEKLK